MIPPTPDNVVYLDDYRPHAVGEVMCARCYYRWISVYPAHTLLKDFECPNCGKYGAVIHTGQSLQGRSTGGGDDLA